MDGNGIQKDVFTLLHAVQDTGGWAFFQSRLDAESFARQRGQVEVRHGEIFVTSVKWMDEEKAGKEKG